MPIHVEYAAVQQTYNATDKAHADVEQQLSQLKTMINGLTASGFRTEIASAKFQISYEQWDRGAQQVMLGLAGMSTYLKSVESRHLQLDQELGAAAG